MAELVDWALAERIGTRAAKREPLAASYHYVGLEADFADLTPLAERLVAAETGLKVSSPARSVVIDRADWVRANISSFRRLLDPLGQRLGTMTGPAAAVMRRTAAAEIGLILGWMSGRVLGQYDLLVADEGDDTESDGGSNSGSGDAVYYVGPNILSLEKRFGFPPREFRLWIALHENTHRAQFLGVDWMRAHYLGLVDRMLGSIDTSPGHFLELAWRAIADLRAGRARFSDGGVARLMATPEQRVTIDRIAGLMSLLEGHGDVTMDRAGQPHIPSAARFARVLRSRRQQGTPAARFIQRLVGLEAKMSQYAMGEEFIAAIESAKGPDAVAAAWRGPEWLPTLAEIRNPREWMERVEWSEELVG